MSFIIGITGGSASGKTTFIERLKSHFDNQNLTIISQDNYYKPLEEQRFNENGEVNFDEPQSINLEKFESDIWHILNGNSIQIASYNFNNPDIPKQTILLEPSPILVLEGLFMFNNHLKSLTFDLKVFVETEESLKLNRRIKRDTTERGMSEEEVYNQWHNFVLPAYNQYLLPQKKEADIIVANNHDFEDGFNQVISKLSSVYGKQK